MFITRLKKLFVNIGLTPPTFALLFCLIAPDAHANTIPSTTEVSEAIAALIASQHNPLLTKPDFSAQADQLNKLYELNDKQLLWLGKDRSLPRIEKALTLLEKADLDALDPNDYDAKTLQHNYQLALTIPQSAVNELVKFDTALSISLLRFIDDLHNGKVKPQQFRYPEQFGNKQSLDPASLLKQSIEQQTLAQIPEIAAPQFEQYRKLKQALIKYRSAPKEPSFEPLIIDKSLRLGDRYSQLTDLRKRLITLGLLSPEESDLDPLAEKVYSKSLVEAVKDFQSLNGLQVDGILGSKTAAMLNQSLDQKIRQIELAMERLRWLPENISGPLIIVNIPAYQLWALNSLDDPEALNMKVIVGKAMKNQTPVLFAEMKYLEFMPYWNIPRNIMNKEILPKLYNDWGYLESQNIELVKVYEGSSSSWDSVFDDIRRGRLRARQRPGKKNPLGKVKFIFPNKADVYLHDTSTHNLFNKSRRDLSHGCVRVEQAEKLAEFVLSHQPNSNWDLEKIRDAMEGSKTRRVPLKKAIPVLFVYTTTFVDQDNRVHFYFDVYNQDAALEKALGKVPSMGDSSLLTSRPSTSS